MGRVELQSAEAQVAQARASVDSARVDLERTIIKAPISGRLAAGCGRGADGGRIASTPTLFTIAQDLAKMEVHAAIDEADVGKLREGLDARSPSMPTRGRVPGHRPPDRSNPNVAQNVVTYDAILRVDNPEQKLRPGMTANSASSPAAGERLAGAQRGPPVQAAGRHGAGGARPPARGALPEEGSAMGASAAGRRWRRTRAAWSRRGWRQLDGPGG